MSPGPISNSEIEATLAIVSPNPQRVIEQLERFDRLAGCDLRPSTSRTLRDVYLDAPAFDLRAHGYALRLRRDGSTWYLALKGRAERLIGGAVRRVEIETTVSAAVHDPNVYARFAAELGKTGLQDARRDRLWDALREAFRDPRPDLAAAVERCGLTPVQDRTTHRRDRDCVDVGGTARARMSIDSVTYNVVGRDIRHHEIEIESLRDPEPEFLGSAVRELVATFGAPLRPWWHSKLETGLALEALLQGTAQTRTQPTPDFVKADGDLTVDAYAALQSFLGTD